MATLENSVAASGPSATERSAAAALAIHPREMKVHGHEEPAHKRSDSVVHYLPQNGSNPNALQQVDK